MPATSTRALPPWRSRYCLPRHEARTREKKLDLYMESGIDECLIVDPSNHAVVVYVFRNHEIAENAMYMQGQTARSVRFPGLQVAVDALF